MSEPFSEAIVLLFVGMITIFTILALVVLSGNVLIQLVNRFAPQSTVKQVPKSRQPQTALSPATMAAIVAAVEWTTAGQGKIQSIQKVE